jgi:hypothetical protein
MVVLTMPAAYIDTYTPPVHLSKTKNPFSEAFVPVYRRSASPTPKCFESEDSNV